MCKIHGKGARNHCCKLTPDIWLQFLVLVFCCIIYLEEDFWHQKWTWLKVT